MASSASMPVAVLGASVARVSAAEAVSGSEKPPEPVRRALPVWEPGVVPFGPEMRMDGPLYPAQHGNRWLMQGKSPGKICRQAALLPLPRPRPGTAARTFVDLNQWLNLKAPRGMALA
jgi:hypothetical protein